MSQNDKVNYFGFTDFRNQKIKFGIKNEDRSRHVYIIGKTGMGKSTLLENMAAQDILNGEGMCFVDPHGSAIDALIEYIPEHRVQDVVYFAPFDTEYPISFNVLEDVDPDKRHLVMAGLMASFKKIWPDSFSARMEYILANTLLALLEFPGATLLGVNRMLAEKDYRDMVIANVTDSSVKAFWIDEYNKWDPRYAREAGAAIQNKIGQFTANPLIRNIIGQQKTSFNLREMMDNQKILLVNLSKGQIGEANGNLLGGMLITKLYLAAMSRADVGVQNLKKLPNFFFFVDEFQNFANESFADILSEARKYKLNLTVAHQYVEQMEDAVASAIFGNVGTMITFRIGATDAEVFEKQFAPTFTAEDIVNLGKFQIYLSLMIDGIGSRPFSAATLPPIPTPEVSLRKEMIGNSRYFFAQKRAVVEAEIEKWYEPIKKPVKKKINQNPHLNQNKQKESKESRDFATPLKKTLKEIDEKEAELEMKKTVSPKLSLLLDKLNVRKGSDKKIPEVIENIKKKEVSTEPKKIITQAEKINHDKAEVITQEKKDKQKIDLEKNSYVKSKKDRSSQKETLSSLKSVLQKAIKNKPEKKNNRREFTEEEKLAGIEKYQEIKKESPEKSGKINHVPQVESQKKIEPKQEKVKKEESKTKKSEKNKEEKSQQEKEDAMQTKKVIKEVPEDILKSILE